MNITVFTVLQSKLIGLPSQQNTLLFIIDRESQKLKIINRFENQNDKIMFLNVVFITRKMLSVDMSKLFKFFNLKTLIFYNLEQTSKIIELIFICSLKKSNYINFNDTL